tara:strand:+ start:2430 stop:2819 length:390 start_codon:yes stop_codon:yes gene_type:complete
VSNKAKRDIWYQLDARLFEKFEVMRIAQALKITINETVGALVRLWSISITQFPEGKGQLVAGQLKVTVQDLPIIMALDNDGQQIFDALSECQWIEELDGIIVIPKWDMKIGQTIIKLEKDLERKKAGGL